MPEVVELRTGSPPAAAPVAMASPIQEDLDRADVAREVPGVGVRLGERGRGDPARSAGWSAASQRPMHACSSNSDIGSLAL